MPEFIRRHPGFIASVLLILVGGLLAWLVQTGVGSITVRDVRFQSSGGASLSALLYVPEAASEENPAPAVLAVHGYINSRETQSPYAIELARRGYVVLALDQRGHGFSDPPAFAEGFGGPAALAHLRSLSMVDGDQVVLAGHSMGGWTVLTAAAQMPDAYQSVVVSGSSTGSFGVPEGSASFPRNFGLVYGRYDEFSASMWGSTTGVGIVNTDKLKAQFGVSEAVEEGRLYGAIADGTARQLYQLAQTHPANHITGSGIAAVVDWVQRTSRAPNPIPASQQVWQWKEFATAVSLLGAFMFLVTAGPVIMRLGLFSGLVQTPSPAAGIRNRTWWVAAAIFTALPALTYFPFQGWAAAIPANAFLGQNLTNGFMVWAAGNALISLALFLIWHFRLGGRIDGGTAWGYGLAPDLGFAPGRILQALLLAFVVVGALYLMLAINHFLFTADFRFWVIAVKQMSMLHLRLFLVYLVPFTLFFTVFAVLLHGQMRDRNKPGLVRACVTNALLAGGGIAGLLFVQYSSLFLTGSLAIPSQALLTIVALQFVVILPLAAIISTRYFYATGQIYSGAFINGLFVTWLIVAGQATHYAY